MHAHTCSQMMHACTYTQTCTCAHRHTCTPAVHQEWLGVCVAVVFSNLYEELEQWASIQRNAKIWPSREVELPHCLCLAGLLHLAGEEERRNTVHSIHPKAKRLPSFVHFSIHDCWLYIHGHTGTGRCWRLASYLCAYCMCIQVSVPPAAHSLDGTLWSSLCTEHRWRSPGPSPHRTRR